MLGGAVLTFSPFVMGALAGANVDGCGRRDVSLLQCKREKKGSVWEICTEMDGKYASGQEQTKTKQNKPKQNKTKQNNG